MRPTAPCVLAIVLILASAADGLAAGEKDLKAEDLKTEDLKTVVNAGSAFGCDLYAKVRSRPGNLFLSPYSISTALAMTYGGAGGHTAQQMAQVLHCPGGDPQRLHAAAGALQAALCAEDDKQGYQLRIANRLWGQVGSEFRQQYLDLTERHYRARMGLVDFAADAESARQTINQWVGEQTRGKIENLLPLGTVTRKTKLVLTNATYFRARWEEPFDEKYTRQAPFHVSKDRQVKVPMMHRAGAFGFGDTEDAQVLHIPYRKYRLWMAVVLPTRRDGLAAIEATLSPKKLAEWQKTENRWGLVDLPRFKIGSQFDLAETLSALGMPLAFGEGADFSGIADQGKLRLGAVVHEAMVNVNEAGTEAAAATAVVEPGASPNPPVFRADHPFLFFIFDADTGTVVFLGRVTDPTA